MRLLTPLGVREHVAGCVAHSGLRPPRSVPTPVSRSPEHEGVAGGGAGGPQRAPSLLPCLRLHTSEDAMCRSFLSNRHLVR